MKITMDIDCTPEEARTLLGLPDVKPMQEEMMAAMRDRVMAAVDSTDPGELMRMWMPGAAGLEQMRDIFTSMGGMKRNK